jgi:xanthine dehydrogenase YagR molybdenum-binding subunit
MGRKVTFRAGMAGAEKDIEVEIHDADCEPWGVDAKLRTVGTEVERLDGPAKVTGTAKYTMDVRPEGMLWTGFVASPHAHAEVESIDASGARAVPGCLDVRTHEGRKVTYAGQIVAAVCGETPQAVDDALARIRVVYRPLPHAVTTEDAMHDGAPQVDPSPRGRIRWDNRASRNPDVAKKAVDDAEVKASGTWRTQIQTHSALEPHGTVSRLEADGSATVWASTQSTTSVQGLGGTLGVKAGQVRVLTPHMGGGFGAKFGVQPWDVEAAEFAKALKRPVRAILDRRMEHLVGGNRPDSIQELTLAGTRDGTFTGLVGRAMGTAGNGAHGAGCANTAVYRLPAVAMEQATVPTFTQRGVAFRAPGHPQGIFALEGVVELFAHEAGLDPLQVRLKNDPHPIRQIQWRLGAERIGWASNRRGVPGSDPGPVKRGVGCAAAVWYQKGGGSWNVDVHVERDGTVTVFNGAQDIGTGTRTVLAILVAEELGISPHAIQVRIGDTNFPPGPGSGGSKTAPSLGPAAREAGLRAREGLTALLAAEWGVDATEVRSEGGVFTTASGRQASFREACGLIGDGGLQVRGTRRPNYDGFDGQTAGCQFAQVAVDVETGVIAVEKVVAVHDCGRVIDTLTSRSQVHGGVIQGISYALYEERRLDKNLGDMVNPTFDTYRISGMADTPEIDVVLTSVASGFNNAGMMGLGEPVTVPTAGAVAGAVFNALGVQLCELPMTPDRVLAALGKV